MEKICTICKIKKDETYFSKAGKGCFSSSCKECINNRYQLLTANKYPQVINLENEVWSDVENYEDMYQVSNLGRVKALARKIIQTNGRVLTRREQLYCPQDDCKRGYLKVMLHNKKVKSFFVHRLVATAFIPNPENKRTVNHKNGIKVDNGVENLEWATDSEQLKHAFSELGRHKTLLGKFGKDHHSSKRIVQKSLDGSFIKEWENAVQIQNSGIAWASGVYRCARGKTNQAAGYKWEYIT